jgi:rhamnose transport system permease protein
VALTLGALCSVMALIRPEYFASGNLVDLFLANLPVLVIASGMTLVMLAGDIDISVGSVFAVCAVTSGLLAKAGVSMPVVLLSVGIMGAAIASISGWFIAYLRLPSIVVTLAMMIALRDALRWATQGAWVQDLPGGFQWLGLSQRAYPLAAGACAAALMAGLAWSLRLTAAGRLLYATGSNADAARLAGIDTSRVRMSAFACLGALTGLGAMLNAMRFNQIPANTGIGLELKVIAAVVVGGTAITGGRGTLVGTLLGVALLGAIGPALTFLGVSAYWERAIQGGIILVAVAAERFPRRSDAHAVRLDATHA